jgi:hypothetical protein
MNLTEATKNAMLTEGARLGLRAAWLGHDSA